jgi:hypothetical protein
MSNFDPLELDKIYRPGCEYEASSNKREENLNLRRLSWQPLNSRSFSGKKRRISSLAPS